MGVIATPAGDPVNLGVGGEQAQHAQALIAAAGDLPRLVEVDALYLAQLTGVDERLDLPVLGHGVIGVPGSKVDAEGGVRLHHGVWFCQAGRHRLLAVDRLDAGAGAVDDDLRVGSHWQDGDDDVDLLLCQHLMVVGISDDRMAI